MKDSVSREFKAVRREVKILVRELLRHFEARIDNMEKRIIRDLANTQRQLDDLDDRLTDAERGNAGISAAEVAKEKAAAHIDTWKLAVLGFSITIILAIVIFVANLLTAS